MPNLRTIGLCKQKTALKHLQGEEKDPLFIFDIDCPKFVIHQNCITQKLFETNNRQSELSWLCPDIRAVVLH